MRPISLGSVPGKAMEQTLLDTVSKCVNDMKVIENSQQGFVKGMEQVSQRSCGCPLPGSVQGLVGWSSEQPGLVEDVTAHGRRVGTS